MKETMNYGKMCKKDQTTYDNLYHDVVKKIRGARLYDGDEPYFELKINKNTEKNAETIKTLIENSGYVVTNDVFCEGSDYPSRCIFFGRKENK